MNSESNVLDKKVAAVSGRPIREGLFFISCPARTGSSMLVNMLQMHPAITCHMEIFNPRRVEGFWGVYRERLSSEPDLEPRLSALRTRDPVTYVYKVALDPQGRDVVGFKFKHDEFLLPTFAGARSAISADTDIKVIMLHRRNLLKRYLSHVSANRTGVTMTRVGDKKKVHTPPTLDPRACLKDFQTITRRAQFVRQMLKDHGLLDVSYEELVGNGRDDAVSRILSFLGVQQRALQTSHSKLAQDDLAEEIANYAELKSFFSDSPYAVFFED
jgi:LPS sulfotransferase NodH